MNQVIFGAIRDAVCAHGDQKRKDDGRPYADHVIEVGEILARAGADEDVVVAGILHDILEDTAWTTKRLEDEYRIFSKVVEFVCEVTDDPNKTKEEQKRAQLAKMDRHGMPVEAQCIKMADAISNCRTLLRNPPEKWSRERALGYIAFKTLFAKKWIANDLDFSLGDKLALDLLRIGLEAESEIHKLGYTFESLAEHYLVSRREEKK